MVYNPMLKRTHMVRCWCGSVAVLSMCLSYETVRSCIVHCDKHGAQKFEVPTELGLDPFLIMKCLDEQHVLSNCYR